VWQRCIGRQGMLEHSGRHSWLTAHPPGSAELPWANRQPSSRQVSGAVHAPTVVVPSGNHGRRSGQHLQSWVLPASRRAQRAQHTERQPSQLTLAAARLDPVLSQHCGLLDGVSSAVLCSAITRARGKKGEAAAERHMGAHTTPACHRHWLHLCCVHVVQARRYITGGIAHAVHHRRYSPPVQRVPLAVVLQVGSLVWGLQAQGCWLVANRLLGAWVLRGRRAGWGRRQAGDHAGSMQPGSRLCSSMPWV